MGGADAADVVAAVDDQSWVDGVYALSAHANPDAFDFAIVLWPYDGLNLVATHYAIVAATGGRRIAGKVMYVNGALAPPTPMFKARRLTLTPFERAAARARIDARRAEWEHAPERFEIEAKFKRFAMAEFGTERDHAPEGPPYRGAITIDFERGILGIVADPFPTLRRRRVLVVAEDDAVAAALRDDFEVVHVDDGWGAVEHVEKTEFDVILCALRVSGMSGASVHRLIATARPDLAKRIAFMASAGVAASAPAATSARVLALPISVERVKALLE